MYQYKITYISYLTASHNFQQLFADRILVLLEKSIDMIADIGCKMSHDERRMPIFGHLQVLAFLQMTAIAQQIQPVHVGTATHLNT
jgi:hypothetical protein